MTDTNPNQPPIAPEPSNAPQAHLSPATLMSALAVTLSFAALLVSLFEALAVRAEQKADVWPYLDVSTRYTSEGYSLLAINKGVGPARVKSWEMTLDGKPYQSLDTMVLETLGEEEAFSYDLYRTSSLAPGVLSPDEAATLFAVPWQPRTRRLAQAWSQRVDMTLCYCSIYDDCWQASKNAPEPTPIAACPRSKAAP